MSENYVTFNLMKGDALSAHRQKAEVTMCPFAVDKQVIITDESEKQYRSTYASQIKY